MKIILTNKTHWRSDQIRQFIRTIMKEERPDLCRRGAPALRVQVSYNRQKDRGHCSGYATYHSNWMRIMLPSQTVDRIDLAHCIAHELAHTRGMRHTQMRGDTRYTRTEGYRARYAWAESIPLVKMLPVIKNRPDQIAKLKHATSMLNKARTRERRATTIRKKWELKVRRLARVAQQIVEEIYAPDPKLITEVIQ